MRACIWIWWQQNLARFLVPEEFLDTRMCHLGLKISVTLRSNIGEKEANIRADHDHWASHEHNVRCISHAPVRVSGCLPRAWNSSAEHCFLCCIIPLSTCRDESCADSSVCVSVVCFAPLWLSHSFVSVTGVAALGDQRPWWGLNLSHPETPKRRTWDPKVALQTWTLNKSAWRSVQSPCSQAVAGLCNLPRKKQDFCNSTSFSSLCKIAIALNCSHQSHQLSCQARDEGFIFSCRKMSEVLSMHCDMLCNSLGLTQCQRFPKECHPWPENEAIHNQNDSWEPRHG